MRVRKPRFDLVGRQFGRLTILRWEEDPVRDKLIWVCVCECGRPMNVTTYALTSGNTKSCGCLRRDNRVALNEERRRSAAGHRARPEYAVWQSMKARCLNKNRKEYPRYGGRGITVCDQWRDSFQAFFDDMGARPSAEYSIERLDNDGPYAPHNCVWATIIEQANNRSNNAVVTVDGQEKSITQWAREAGMTPQGVRWRLQNGWKPEEAIASFDGRKERRSPEA